MRIRTWSAALIALAIVGSSCSENDVAGLGAPGVSALAVVAGATTTLPAVRISEFHYDNVGTDFDEQIEISGPAGTSLNGWQLVLYNGANGASYNTKVLGDVIIPATCGSRGVLVFRYPQDGIQNGSPDGMALVRPNGNVVEFLSYEGPFAAANGPAIGVTATDVIGRENSEPVDPVHGVTSLARASGGGWTKGSHSFGSCNDNGAASPATGDVATITVAPSSASVITGSSQLFTATAFDSDNQQIVDAVFVWSTSSDVATVNGNGFVTAAHAGDAQIVATTPNGVAGSASLHVVAPQPLPPTRFSEIHYDNVGVDADEAIEIEGPAGTDLNKWQIVLYDGNGGALYNDIILSGVISGTCSGRGVAVTTYPSNGIQNGPDAIALVNPDNTVVEFLSYEGVVTATDGPAAGMTSTDIGIPENSGPLGQSLQRDANGLWHAAPSSFGTCNPPPPPDGGQFIVFTGRSLSDPPLPVGFEAQIFATEHAGSAVVPTTITWVSENPDIASVDANGVIHANSAGTATFRATATDGTTDSYSLPTAIATAGTTAQYAGNAEFGEPADGDASNDFIIRRPQYITSFNKNRNTPNWVSYDLDASQFGDQDRCNCFTQDPLLPGDFTHLTTADYTGAGTAAGYPIDRGHLARSFDRTTGTLDNARTFYLSNIIPQAADLNQGPWAIMENDLGDLARFQNKEVYIIAGIAGSKGTVKGEDKITIPAQVWKVALILPRDAGLASVHDYRDVQAIAVIMPNDAGTRNVNWHTYETTVDAVEAASGYDLLALLPDKIERAVESNTKPPVAVANGPYASMEGSAVSVSGSESFDEGAAIVGYSWTFGDGGSGTGATASHTYVQDGTYMVRLIVTDNVGVADTSFTSASIANVVPVVATFAGATLLPGETYSASGSFTDPGADPWSATANYGDNGSVESLLLNGKTFALSHTYMGAGLFTVTVRVSDDDATGTRTQSVTVLATSEGLTQALRLVQDLASAAGLNAGNANSLNAKIDAALKQLETGNSVPAANQLRALLRELDAMVGSGRVTEQDAQPLRTMVSRVIRSISL